MTRVETTESSNHGSLGQLSPQLGDLERNYVYSVAMKYVKDEEAAADVAQEALLLAHRHRDSFRGDSRFSTWLYRVAATTSLMYLRTRRRRSREVLAPGGPREEPGILETQRDVQSGPDRDVSNRQSIEQIKQCLERLGEKYQRIFWMRYFEGYTETEIASQLDLTLATVKTRAHRARVAVRESLRAVA